MGFTSPVSGGAEQEAAPAGGGDTAAKKLTFGDRLGTYFQEHYPIAGGLAGMVFGNNAPSPTPAPGQGMAAMPAVPMQQDQPDYTSMLAMNAQPKQGGGLSAILKLLEAA